MSEESKEWFETDTLKIARTDADDSAPEGEPDIGYPIDPPADEPAGEPDPDVVEPTPVDEPEESTEGPKEFDISSYIKEHQDSLTRYLEYQSTNFDEMAPEKAVEMKLREDNPDWSDSDIKSELEDRYGIGLKPVDIDEDEMTHEEIREAKEVNRAIQRGARNLKRDAREAVKHFNEIKGSLELPQLELPDVPQMSLDKANEVLQNEAKQLRKQWVEAIDETIGLVDKIKHEVNFDDGEGGKVALDLEYTLDETEKKELQGYLHEYTVSQKEVDSYKTSDGGADLESFVKDKVYSKKVVESMLRHAASQAYAQGRKAVLKGQLVNYQDTPSGRASVPSRSGKTLQDAQKLAWGIE